MASSFMKPNIANIIIQATLNISTKIKIKHEKQRNLHTRLCQHDRPTTKGGNKMQCLIVHYQYLFLYNQSYQTQLAEERTSCTYSSNNNLQTKGTGEKQELQVHMCTRT